MEVNDVNNLYQTKAIVLSALSLKAFSFAHHCLQDQAKKALESALGGKKTEFEKWDKEIKKREEAGGGGYGGGGWWRRWFGGSDGEHFWHEAQQVALTLLVLAVMVSR